MTKIPDELNEDIKGPWLHKSISEQRKEFAKWLEAGNRPDDHPIVRPVGIRPPEDVTPETIAEIELKASYIRQDWFHCNDCGTTLKFKDHGQVMSFGDGHLYLIGRDCGNDLQKEMKRQGRKSFRRQMEVDAALTRLIEFQPNADEWQIKFQSIEYIAREVLTCQRSISSAKRLYDVLVQCRKDQGILRYQSQEERADNDPEKIWNKYKTVIKNFPKKIRGTSLFELRLPMLASMKELQRILHDLEIKSVKSPEWLIKMQTEEGGSTAIRKVTLLNQLPLIAEQCSDEIRSVQEFFAPENIAALNEWIVLDKSLKASMRLEGTDFHLSTPELPDGKIIVTIENLLSWN